MTTTITGNGDSLHIVYNNKVHYMRVYMIMENSVSVCAVKVGRDGVIRIGGETGYCRGSLISYHTGTAMLLFHDKIIS